MYKADEVFKYFNENQLLDEYIQSKNKLTSKLKSIDIVSEQQRIGSERATVYLISRDKLKDLCERYQVLGN